jgi:hypothetical protein
MVRTHRIARKSTGR